jgi:hypothetical protein
MHEYNSDRLISIWEAIHDNLRLQLGQAEVHEIETSVILEYAAKVNDHENEAIAADQALTAYEMVESLRDRVAWLEEKIARESEKAAKERGARYAEYS